MKTANYNTAAIGKWHLGDHPDLWPNKRGFDYFYGFSNGGYSYWGVPKKSKDGDYFIQENGKPLPVSKTTYLTDDFTDKAVDFIDKKADDKNPFFLYLAYNAPHAPLQAPQKYLDRTEHIQNNFRTVYAAMILAVDDGVGKIWDVLKKNKIDDNTIIIFLSDNGGTYQAMNYPRRAYKGNMFEGGTKVPFAMYWKNKIKPGTTFNGMISALDICATAVDVAGVKSKEIVNPLDGVSLVPYLTKSKKGNPHDELFWRVCGGFEYAARVGDYKIVKRYYTDDLMLFNIAKDPCEIFDIAKQNPQKVAELQKEYLKWNKGMITPRWKDTHSLH